MSRTEERKGGCGEELPVERAGEQCPQGFEKGSLKAAAWTAERERQQQR